MHPRRNDSSNGVALCVMAALCLGSTGVSSARKKEKVVPPLPPVVPPSEPLSCRAELKLVSTSPGAIHFTATLRNEGRDPVYLLHSSRMPYVLVPTSQEVVLAYAIQPLPKFTMFGLIATLETVAIPPGRQLERTVTLGLPLHVSTHFYGSAPYKGELAPQLQVTAEFGLIGSPLDPKLAHQSYTRELDAQRLCRSQPVIISRGKLGVRE